MLKFLTVASSFLGLHVVGKGNWKNEKLESLQLESFCLTWKEPIEIGKFLLKLQSFAGVGKFCCRLFPSSIKTFQLQHELSNFSPNFST